MFCSVRSIPFVLNSFRSVSTKYWLCSVSICSFPFRLNSFRSVSTKYRFCSVSLRSVYFRFFPFLQNINRFFPFCSFLFHSVHIDRNQFLSICCFLNVLRFPLRSVVFFVCNTNLAMVCLLPSPNRCA